jgi:hypothetical protein
MRLPAAMKLALATSFGFQSLAGSVASSNSSMRLLAFYLWIQKSPRSIQAFVVRKCYRRCSMLSGRIAAAVADCGRLPTVCYMHARMRAVCSMQVRIREGWTVRFMHARTRASFSMSG